MKDRGRHIINTQSIELSFEEIEDSIDIQNRIAEVYYDRMQPAITALFDEMAGEKYWMTIDRLEIDSGILSNKNWEAEWVENTIRKLKEELITKVKKPVAQTTAYNEEVAVYFLFFLEHGRLPWNSRVNTVREIEEEIKFSDEAIQQLKQLIRRIDTVSERLVYSFLLDFRERLLPLLVANKIPGMETLIRNEAMYKDPAFQIAVLEVLTDEKINNDPDGVIKSIRQRHKEILKKDDPEVKENKPAKELPLSKETEQIFIENAGLIILHPFLAQLFEKTGLLKDNEWLDETARDTAVMMLQYLVTNADEYAEYNLPLNKILCGITIDAVVQEIKLTELIKEECELLLNDVISHWSVLKNTGTDAMREAFLQRQGKLTRVDDGWQLQVEQKSLDILLHRLPWGIGTIKLPWMDDIVYTEWV